ncbi:MAG TPA: sulfatase, partial [Planctomycetaceae bacterium]|nr:sulfatase [Planctomycetaceae bacterium]
MNPFAQHALQQTRRYFFGQTAAGIGTAALASVLNPDLLAGGSTTAAGMESSLHHRPSAKRIIWLFMADAP